MDRNARRRVLETVLHENQPALCVNSPPGAGKTALVEAVTATAVQHFGLRVGVVAPRVEQIYDIVRRLVTNYTPMRIELLHSADRPPPAALTSLGIRAVTRASTLANGPGVVIATAAKLVHAVPDLIPNGFDLLTCDEAYQLPWKEFAAFCHLARRRLLVGDPGQLPPLVRAELARFEAARHKVHWPVPKELMRLHPDLPRIDLPTTWRLPQDTVEFVQPSFYTDLPFGSGAPVGERRITYTAAGMGDPIDAALDQLAGGASMVGIVLPPRALELDDVDDEVAELAAHVIARLLARGVEWRSRRRLTEDDIGYVDAHVASGAAVRERLRGAGIGRALMTDTPEIWQGLQRPIMVAKHTLSGTSRFDGFSLEPGRLCVMTSRHQLACIIVGRDGVGEALERHQHNCADRPSGADNPEWLGWRAHTTLWSMLEANGRLVRV